MGRVTARSRGLRRRLSLTVPAARAFAAVGTLGGIRGWWTPVVDGSTKQGGILTLRFRGVDETIRFRVDAREPSRVAWVCLGHSALPEWTGTRLVFAVRSQPREGACVLELCHEGLVPTLTCYASCRAGWEHFLKSLVAWAETGRGAPFGLERARRAPTERLAAYQTLVRSFADDERVTLPTGTRGRFGEASLRVDGKIFAMWVRDALVVKLPPASIDAAIAAGRGERLAMGPKRVMRQWLVVREPEKRWAAIARRALEYVSEGR